MALLAIPLFDELWTAVPVIDAPGIEDVHGLGHDGAALTLFVLPAIVAAFIEARLLLWAAGRGARAMIALSQGAVAIAAAAAALATAPWVLGAALGIAGATGGVGGALAQGALIDAAPDQRERTMTRWTLAGALGDLAAPVVVAVLAVVGLGWRVALLGIAAAMLLYAASLLGATLPAVARAADEDDESDAEAGTLRLRDALRRPALLGWLAAATSCTLLDEILVAFAALHLRLDRGASEASIGAVAAIWAMGCAIGLWLTERSLARVAPRRLLGWGAAGCTIAALAWWAMPTVATAAVGLGVLGLCSAPLYPIAKAQAYATVPGRAALVGAASQLFVVVELAAPWGLGLVGDAAGLRVALGLLACGPIVLLVAALRSRAWPRASS